LRHGVCFIAILTRITLQGSVHNCIYALGEVDNFYAALLSIYHQYFVPYMMEIY